MPWSKSAIWSSEKRRILLATSEFSAESGPAAQPISVLPAVTTAPPAAAYAAVAKQRGQLPQLPQVQQPPPSTGKTAPVSRFITVVNVTTHRPM